MTDYPFVVIPCGHFACDQELLSHDRFRERSSDRKWSGTDDVLRDFIFAQEPLDVTAWATLNFHTLEPHSLTCHAWCMAGQPREFPAAAIEALTKGHKIEAIKIVRQEWSLGLKEAAKDAVETYVKTRPDLTSQFQEAGNNRLWLWLLVLLTAILLFYRFGYR